MGITYNHLSFDVQNLSDIKALIFECFAYENDILINEIILQKQAYRFLELLGKSFAVHKQENLTKKMNPYVSQTLEIISKNAHQNISVASIADQLSINSSYLSRLFKADIGSSIKEYINEIRLSIGNDLFNIIDYSINEFRERIWIARYNKYDKA